MNFQQLVQQIQTFQSSNGFLFFLRFCFFLFLKFQMLTFSFFPIRWRAPSSSSFENWASYASSFQLCNCANTGFMGDICQISMKTHPFPFPYSFSIFFLLIFAFLFAHPDINDCLSSGCTNGVCVDGIQNYQCLCNDGTTGLTCSSSANTGAVGNGLMSLIFPYKVRSFFFFTLFF